MGREGCLWTEWGCVETASKPEVYDSERVCMEEEEEEERGEHE